MKDRPSTLKNLAFTFFLVSFFGISSNAAAQGPQLTLLKDDFVANPEDPVRILIRGSDGTSAIFVNDQFVFQRQYGGPSNISQDLGARLTRDHNTITIVLHNGGGSGNISYRLDVNGDGTADVDRRLKVRGENQFSFVHFINIRVRKSDGKETSS